MILAGDVGGTKTRLAVFDGDRLVRRATLPSAHFDSLERLVADFMAGSPERLESACLGVAGPVQDDTCRATNLPWVIEAHELARSARIPRVRLVNDFHALAIGIWQLRPDELVSLNEGPSDPRGPFAVIGAGTGLGQAVVLPGPDGLEVLSSEGGHTDFAPRNDLEIDLLKFLLGRHHRVSYERVLSGPGLLTLYAFLCEREADAGSPTVRDEITRAGEDGPAVISAHALRGDDALCTWALELFVSIYGAEAGNLGLKVVARGGVFVAGGIAPKILPKLLAGEFRKAFIDKGRMSPLLERMPVKVVLDPDAGLFGAAALARRSA
jgi:glucokinase